jgi:erythronate-4-phosphate dehydrogenase
MKIVADENIPALKDYFQAEHELILKNGRHILAKDVSDADILLVRSITKVNAELLQNSKVKFVGSVTTGVDHLDVAWLNSAGIAWSGAQGCNAVAVVEYVITAIAVLQRDGYLRGENLRAGVIGVGRIGSKVADILKLLGFEVLLFDPVRAQHEPGFNSINWDDLQDLDLVTLHTPLTHELHGEQYPTYHLIAKEFLQRQKNNTVLINTSRGEVIDFMNLACYGRHLRWCLDVWEHEPQIATAILPAATIATPHIAGYSAQSKFRGMAMIYAVMQGANLLTSATVSPINFPTTVARLDAEDWREVVLNIFDPVLATQQMQAALRLNPLGFDRLRKDFITRHEFNFIENSAGTVNSMFAAMREILREA